jgi:hypothetical protein
MNGPNRKSVGEGFDMLQCHFQPSFFVVDSLTYHPSQGESPCCVTKGAFLTICQNTQTSCQTGSHSAPKFCSPASPVPSHSVSSTVPACRHSHRRRSSHVVVVHRSERLRPSNLSGHDPRGLGGDRCHGPVNGRSPSCCELHAHRLHSHCLKG